MSAPRQRLAGAAFATTIALGILIALGVWQLQRLRWKEGLLAQIDAAEKAPPRRLTTDTPALFTRVTVHGVLRGPVGLYGSEVRGDRLGAQLIEVLERAAAPPVLVVLGWVDTDSGMPKAITGEADITGYVRVPQSATWLSPADDVEARRFYALDPAVIAPALDAPNAAPFTLVALGLPPASPRMPLPADTLPRPVNNHLQYALTWFGLAASLVGVFLTWAFKEKQSFVKKKD